MAELRALCAGCRKPLSGPLLANRCNHVFHRACLLAAGKGSTCGRCQAPLVEEEALSLFGLGFEGADDASSIAVMAAIAELTHGSSRISDEVQHASGWTYSKVQAGGSSSSSLGSKPETSSMEDQVIDLDEEAPLSKLCCLQKAGGETGRQLEEQPPPQVQSAMPTQVDSPEDGPAGGALDFSAAALLQGSPDGEDMTKWVARICMLRRENQHRQTSLTSERDQLRRALANVQEQQTKLRAARRIDEKREAESVQVADEVVQCKDRCEKLMLELNQMRQRDAVLEYWEDLRSKGPQDALQILSRTVNMVSNPWKILTQVARLRDHHRQRLDTFEKDSAQADVREKRARRELAEIQRSLTELKMKMQKEKVLARRNSDSGASAKEELPLEDALSAKRLRS